MKSVFAIGLFTGLVTGLIIGLLYAPEKGSDTRKKIADKGGEITEGIKQKFHQFGEFVNEKLDNSKGVYSHFIRVGKSNV